MSKESVAPSQQQSTSSPPFFSMGPHTFQVSVRDVFVANRHKLVDHLIKQNDADSNSSSNVGVIVYLQGGESTTRFDSDHEPIFRQESYFYYLCGVKEPDCALAVDVGNTGNTTLFVPRLPADYATVMGKIRTPDDFKKLYHVDAVKYTDEIEETLLGMLTLKRPSPQIINGMTTTTNGGTTITNGTAPPSHNKKLLLMKGPNSDSGKTYQPPVFKNQTLNDSTDTTTLFPVLAECRVIKSAAEQLVLQHVTEITSFAHAYVMRNFKAGMYEYQAESLFRHYCHYNYGARLVGYTPICGCGPSAAVLHYGHAGEPNTRQSSTVDSSICLFDMGAEYFGYGSDVTCSFPASGKFSEQQKIIYQAVYNAQVAVYKMMKPGVAWTDCHKTAEAAILTALADAGMVIPNGKTIDELVEMRLGAVFQPHGLGHFIGIDTHDVGGYLPGHPPRSTQPGLKSLRTARILQANMVLTVEPGCYFIDHLLDSALASDSPLKDYLNADAINAYRGFGGVRLEDVVQVTDDDGGGIMNYTLCPRTVAEVEATMAGGQWPPATDTAPELRRFRLTDPTPLPSPPSL